MREKLLHTPDGVRDIYNGECARKGTIQDKIKGVLGSYGYQDIETPTFEFFDVFGNEVGTIPSNELYKFFDREGNTLVLRPDITPSIARAAAKYFTEKDMPLRLSYLGNTFINTSSYRGRLKETTQLGAELMGDNTVEADGEMVAMVVETLLATGLGDFQVSIGNVSFYEGLMEEAGMDKDTEEELKQLILNKNNFGIQELLTGLHISEELKSLIEGLPQMFGSVDVLDRAKNCTGNKKAMDAIERLQRLYDILKAYGYEKYISFDLGMLGKYMYYTGIIFRAFTYEVGEPIIKGGRYDRLLEHFGTPSPSIGFVVVINQLLNALSRQKIQVKTPPLPAVLIYSPQMGTKAITFARDLRAKGHAVEMLRMKDGRAQAEYLDWAKAKGRHMAYVLDEKGSLEAYQIKKDEE